METTFTRSQLLEQTSLHGPPWLSMVKFLDPGRRAYRRVNPGDGVAMNDSTEPTFGRRAW
jgi:hypothetical protein